MRLQRSPLLEIKDNEVQAIPRDYDNEVQAIHFH